MSAQNESEKPSMMAFLKFAMKNMSTFKAIRKREKIRPFLCLANMELAKLDPRAPLYWRRVVEFNQANLELYKGKWFAKQAQLTRDKDYWKKSTKAFNRSLKIAKQLLKALKSGSTKPITFQNSEITAQDTEITFADGVPLIPEITPLVILVGSDYAMGYQYAQQLVQIFGRWILEERSGMEFTREELDIMKTWEKAHEEYTPEVLDFCKGWQAGATDLGITMSYEDVLFLWTGKKKPAKSILSAGEGLPQLPPVACSGAAAWGQATKDGKLVTGSTGDHDMSYQITIIAYPENGYPFIYTAFGATGAISGAGDLWFFGHPAMNSKGVAYVHHGGGPKFLEPSDSWGYGVRRAASVMHILRKASSAQEAQKIELSFPIGDVGNGDQATVGGFYADSEYGYIIEGRKDPVAIREAGLLGETDFLFANNSCVHPAAILSEWMQAMKDEWMNDTLGGWRPIKPTGMTKSLKLFFQWFSGRISLDDLLGQGMMFAYYNSYQRNRYMHRMLDQAVGQIDFEYIKTMFRKSGTIPEGPWKKIVKTFTKDGTWGDISTGHASNAVTVIMKPDEGLYANCAGPAKRGLAPMMPTSTITIYRETNAFWEIKLEVTPEKLVTYTRDKAIRDIKKAEEVLSQLDHSEPIYTYLLNLIRQATDEYNIGSALIDTINEKNGNEKIYNLARAARAFTRAQVRALQAYQALMPPPSEPIELLSNTRELQEASTELKIVH